MSPIFEQGDVVLFQGDSVTDCGRDRFDFDSLGNGYPYICAALFNALYPQLEVTFLNRGISGNRTKDLVDRWEEDCVDLQPDWVSILIGINDTWRRYDAADETTAQEYEANYRNILEQVRMRTKAGLILCEPFVLPFPQDRKAWREDLDPKIHIVRNLAVEYGAIYIPFDGMFAQAATYQDFSYWAKDGVHPTPAGHGLMARHWLSGVKADF